MGIPVNIFNANMYALSMTVNRGAPFAVAAVTASTWVPGTVSSGGPGWDNGGPSTNNFGPGDNSVQVALGTSQWTTMHVTLPNTNPAAVELYIFFPQSGGVGSVGWYALYAGMVVASGTSGLQAGAPPQGLQA